MAQFIPFSPNVEVTGQSILSFVNAIPGSPIAQQFMSDVLAENNLNNIQVDNWYSQALWLNAFKEISTRYGNATLFSIGKAIPKNIPLPPEIKTLEAALNSIDAVYRTSHRNGEIGFYKLLSFNATEKKATMKCKNPYPSAFDRGLIITIARTFSPTSASLVRVELDESKPNRINGDDSCTYTITW